MDSGLMWNLLETSAFGITLLVVIQLWRAINKPKLNGKVPPGSFGLPLIGETLKYMTSMKTSNPTFMAEHTKRFGEMFTSKLMGAQCVIATKSDTIKWVLNREGKQFVSSYPTSFKKVLGEYTSLASHGDKWKSTRKFIGNSLRIEHLRARVSIVEEQVLECLNTWESKDSVSIREETKSLAFNVVALYLLGSRLRSGEVNDSIRKDFYILTEGLFALPIALPGTNFTKAVQARKRILETLERDVVCKPRPVGDEDHYADYLEFMRKENLPGTTEELLLEQTRCHVLGMMFAGHETTANVMLFAVKYISENPKVLIELQMEHDNIRKLKIEDGGLTWDDYKNMRFTQYVITETMRLCNPVALLWRQATEDVELNGYVVPKGWKLLCAIRESNHDPTYFENPSQFNPWRHAHEISDPAKKPSMYGFGGGPRYCPGAELARMELCVFLHHLVTRFDWKICSEDKVSFFPLPKLSKGLQIRVTKRDLSTEASHRILPQ